MKQFWTKYKPLVFLILILIGIINTIWFLKTNEFSQEDFFNKAVFDSYNESYNGIIREKFYLKEGGRNIFVLDQDGITKRLDYVYQNPKLYEFLEIGDTLIKRPQTNSIIIKRTKLDTTINLKFENLKGTELYSKNNKYLNN
ncbi:hypothetical protein [Aestuariibaculum marinum]|uniref:Uncharacterized protein n=1 Tax=Aestuariibaculum marinum TaxID=2683592 RepID=A0A8J6UB96_9FLAO|nr:hypothetical protein [Aestuariibaculum marinum]MBD0825521.1 hypothetical protein [Aestuariibaculum marinum]